MDAILIIVSNTLNIYLNQVPDRHDVAFQNVDGIFRSLYAEIDVYDRWAGMPRRVIPRLFLPRHFAVALCQPIVEIIGARITSAARSSPLDLIE